MSLGSGARLGPYEVVSLLGRGGMGEVYRARDAKLGRDVALKVLPDDLAADSERLARFEREAKTLAALNHPHIAQIYGFEEANGRSALVMELVEGEDLSQRIAQGPVPVDEALPIARQIAEALEAAHEQGIIHRDLKPANVKVRPDGTVKVLDFGLAKAMDPVAVGGQEQLADSPTITTPAMTMRGVILGTAAYMAPEQAKGKPLDKRADIWAFGCVLYEMLTGKRAFDGEDITDVLGAVVRLEPDWTLLPADVPAPIQTLLQGCVTKDRGRRVADISTALFVLEHSAHLAPKVAANQIAAARASHSDRRALWRYVALAGVTALVIGGVAAGLAWQALRPSAPSVMRFVITPPPDQPLTSNPGGVNLAISPDGATIVYQVQRGETVQLYARGIDQLDSRPIPGTEGAGSPFFSPDGAQIGFLAGGKIKKVAVAGGPVSTVSESPDGRVSLSWSADNSIIFAADGANGGIFRVPSTGGQPHRLATPDPQKGELYRAAELLPDGKTILFSIQPTSVDDAKIAVRSLDTGEQKILVEGGTSAHYVSTGHLVYGRSNALMAVPFDLSRLEVTGPAVAVQDGPGVKVGGAARFALAANGTLVYMPATFGTAGPARFVWLTRDGREATPAVAPTLDNPRDPRISPDGRTLAATVGASDEGQIWVHDLTGARQPLKLTFKDNNSAPIWTSAARRILFSSALNPQERNLMSVAADASVLKPELIVADINSQLANSPDGRSIVFGRTGGRTGPDLWLLSTDADSTPRPWLQTAFRESEPSFSPDGRWLAYHSDPTGTGEIWVRPFPGPGAPIRLSHEGGHGPVWSRDGKELFYQDDGRMMAVSVSSNGGLRFTVPRMLFQGGFVPWQPFLDRTFDVAPDGRFLIMESVTGITSPVAPHFVVVLNWFEELKARAPKTR